MLIRTPEGVDVVAVQIAGLIARRIVCDIKPGDKVTIGDTYGLIRFGSRLDTYLPEGSEVLVLTGPAGRRRRDDPCGVAAMKPRVKTAGPSRAHPAERDDRAGDLRWA